MATSLLCVDEEKLYSMEANIPGFHVRALLSSFTYECVSHLTHTNFNPNFPYIIQYKRCCIHFTNRELLTNSDTSRNSSLSKKFL